MRREGEKINSSQSIGSFFFQGFSVYAKFQVSQSTGDYFLADYPICRGRHPDCGQPVVANAHFL